MELVIRIEDLEKKNLSLTQYLFILGLYHQVDLKLLDIPEERLIDLIIRHYISKSGKEYTLLTPAKELFEQSSGIFDEFLKLFPTRVSNQNGETRILSPAGVDTIAGKKMKDKFYRITKNKVEFQKHILICLEREVQLRKKEGNLFWMRNVESWLNKATWEDYEYLLEQPKKEESSGFKVNEIRL